jgi:elongator complex protein 4
LERGHEHCKTSFGLILADLLTAYEVTLSFLLRLRSLIRNTEACVLITLTPLLSASTYTRDWVPKLAQLSDGCFTFQGITSDPVLGPTFPAYSGLLSVHSTPSPHTFLDPSRRFSQLRGLNVAGTTSGSGGGGENNLAFKCMRKRFVVETLHLDVEGGVGERRTTPSTLQANPEPHHKAPVVQSATQLARVHIDAPPERPRDLPSPAEVELPKKAKKKVAFRTADADQYEF